MQDLPLYKHTLKKGYTDFPEFSCLQKIFAWAVADVAKIPYTKELVLGVQLMDNSEGSENDFIVQLWRMAKILERPLVIWVVSQFYLSDPFGNDQLLVAIFKNHAWIAEPMEALKYLVKPTSRIYQLPKVVEKNVEVAQLPPIPADFCQPLRIFYDIESDLQLISQRPNSVQPQREHRPFLLCAKFEVRIKLLDNTFF